MPESTPSNSNLPLAPGNYSIGQGEFFMFANISTSTGTSAVDSGKLPFKSSAL